MTEIKPGKWRLKDGREVVVLPYDTSDDTVRVLFLEDREVHLETVLLFRDAEYLGPAVIGEPDVVALWVYKCGELEQQCRDLEAETVATRELLEKEEERCEELAKELGVFRDTINGFSYENRRLKRGDFTEDEFQNLCNGMTEDDARRFKAGCFSYWPKLFGKQGIAYEFKDGVEIHRYKSVTVMVRGELEGWCYRGLGNNELWYVFGEMNFNNQPPPRTREDAEAWCREQLEPKWREAGEGDVGKACRVKDLKSDDWEPYEQLYAVIDHDFRFLAGDPDDPGTTPQLYAFCEVQE